MTLWDIGMGCTELKYDMILICVHAKENYITEPIIVLDQVTCSSLTVTHFVNRK